MYEIWNEPVQESWEVIKGYHEAVIPAIRAVDPESIIVVGSRHWDQELEEASLNPIKGVKNVAYAIHFYSGTHRQALRDNGARAMKNGVALFRQRIRPEHGLGQRWPGFRGTEAVVGLARRKPHQQRQLEC